MLMHREAERRAPRSDALASLQGLACPSIACEPPFTEPFPTHLMTPNSLCSFAPPSSHFLPMLAPSLLEARFGDAFA